MIESIVLSLLFLKKENVLGDARDVLFRADVAEKSIDFMA